jgi:peptide-methionine (S)-S-oxide reductase
LSTIVFRKYYKNAGVKTSVGYTGGDVTDPNYRLVCSGNTGHAEATQIQFDPSKVSYAELVE